MARTLSWLVAIAVVTPAVSAGEAVDAEHASVAKAAEIVESKLADRRDGYERSLAWTHRYLRNRSHRPGSTKTRVWLRAVLEGKRQVWRELHQESLALTRSRRALDGPGQPDPPDSLAAPVEGAVVTRFGSYRHRRSGVHLSRQGVEMTTHPGEVVRAPLGGRVRFVGRIRGLGSAVVIATADDFYCVLGGVMAAVSVGNEVTPGQAVGASIGHRLFVGLRSGRGSKAAIDPTPLLESIP